MTEESKEVSQEKPQAESIKQDSQREHLPPWLINLDNIKDEKLIEQYKIEIQTWCQQLKKDLHEILTKNGVTEWQLSFPHKGMRIPITLSKGSPFITCKLSIYAYKELKEQVDKETSLDLLENQQQ